MLAEVHIWCNAYFQTGQYGTIGIISAQWRHSHVALGGRWQLLVPLGWRHVRQHPRWGHRELGCARFWKLWSRPVQLVRVEQHDYGMSDWKLERHGCASTNCMLWVHGRCKIKYSSHCKRRYISRKHNATGCCEKKTVISEAPCKNQPTLVFLMCITALSIWREYRSRCQIMKLTYDGALFIYQMNVHFKTVYPSWYWKLFPNSVNNNVDIWK